MSYGAFATKPAFNAGRVLIPPPTRSGLGQAIVPPPSDFQLQVPPPASSTLPSSGVDSGGPTMDELKAAAVNNGVDPALLDQAAAAGADPVQLALMATKGVGAQTELATLDAMNTDTTGDVATGSVLQLGPPAPTGPTDWSAWIQQNAWWVFGGVAALVIIPAVIKKL